MSQSPQINLPGSSNGNASAGSTGDSVCRLKVLCAPVCQHQHIWRLFNIVPGLVECRYQVDIVRQVGEAFITYSNAQAARYARDKLHGLEYPPGAKLEVRLDAPRQSGCSSNIVNNGNNSIIDDNQQGLAQLAETIVKATNLLQASLGNKEESLCNVRLPSPKPLACIDSPVAQRCFLVCQPHPPPISALRDVFSRFGDLIDVYTLHNKTVGYAMYASTKSAEEARKVIILFFH